VTGVVALMYEANPDLTPAEAKECLTSTAVDLVAPADVDPESDAARLVPGIDIPSGHGMVDARGAVVCAAAVGIEAAAPPADGGTDSDDGPTPVTGGGLALAALGVLAVARGLHRRSPRG